MKLFCYTFWKNLYVQKKWRSKMNSKTETVGGVPRVFIYLFILNSFCCPWLSSIYYARRWGKVSLVHSSLDQKFQEPWPIHCIVFLGKTQELWRGICNCQETLGKLLEVIFDGPESCWGWVAILPATLVSSKRDKSGDLCQVCHSNNWPGFKSMPP